MNHFFTLLCFLGASIPAQANPSSCADLAQTLEKFLTTRQITISSARWHWKELHDFHSYFLEAMALDPARVPLSETPYDLIPENMTLVLHQKLDALVEARHIVDKLELGREFDDYLALVESLLEQRRQGLYTQARRVVKRGPLHESYARLVTRMQEQGARHMEFKVAWNQDASPELVQEMQVLSKTLQNSEGGRALASIGLIPTNLARMRFLIFLLIPIVFVTGMTAGILWGRKRNSRVSSWVRDNSEPRV